MGGRDGLLATQMISLSSLSFSFSRYVCAYISEREKTTTKGDREREIDARKQFFIWTFAPRTLSLSLSLHFYHFSKKRRSGENAQKSSSDVRRINNKFLSPLFFLSFFFVFVNACLSSSKKTQKKEHRKEEEEEDFRLSFLFPSFLPSFVCINLSSVSSYYEYEYGYNILLQQC